MTKCDGMAPLDYVMQFAIRNKRDGSTHAAVLVVPFKERFAAYIANNYHCENYFEDCDQPTGYGVTATEAVADLAAKLLAEDECNPDGPRGGR